MKKLLCVCVIAAAFSFASSHVSAADIGPVADSEMGCTVLFDGEISEGDLERLQEAIARNYNGDGFGDPPIICLNSSGGNMLEGIQIADWIFNSRDYFAFGTAIPSGATCVSACAIIFMAGRKGGNAGAGAGSFRLLHPTGNLGFHGPGLPLISRDNNYTAEQLLQVFEAATDAAAALTALTQQDYSGLRIFPTDLLEVVLGTAPEHMHYVRTVGEAAAWNISIWPVNRRPIGDGHDLTANAIFNLDAALRQARNFSERSTDELFSEVLPYQQIRCEYVDTFSSGRSRSIVFTQPFGQGQYTHQLFFRPDNFHGREFVELRADLRAGSTWRSLPEAGYFFFHPDTPIRTLFDDQFGGHVLSGYRIAEDIIAVSPACR